MRIAKYLLLSSAVAATHVHAAPVSPSAAPVSPSAVTTPSTKTVDSKAIESRMATWLAHPLEFGKPPVSVRYRATLPTRIMGEPAEMHLVDFEMPGGIRRRGMVGPVEWAFQGPIDYDRVTDVELVVAFTGWFITFNGLQRGIIETKFEPTTLGTVRTTLTKAGLTDVELEDRYRLGDTEFFELKARRNGRSVLVAATGEDFLVVQETSPLWPLPAVYTLLGLISRGEFESTTRE